LRNIECPESLSLLRLQVPDLNLTVLISEDNLDLVRVKDSARDHHSSVVVVSLVALALEVEDLDGSVFAGDEEPFVLLLEIHGDSIRRETIERAFLVHLPQIIDFDEALRASS